MSKDKLMKYKGFAGSVDFSLEDGVLFGKIECINDLVTFEASNLQELEAAFHESVDDYLETCELIGKEPDKPMSGSFNVRIGTALHKSAYLESKNLNINLNEFIKLAVEEKLNKKQELHMHVHMPEKTEKHMEYTAEYSKQRTDDNVFQFRKVH